MEGELLKMICYEELYNKIFNLGKEIHKDDPYRSAHMETSAVYAERILAVLIDDAEDKKKNELLWKIKCAAIGHDILKDKYFNKDAEDKIINGYTIPQNLETYIQKNMDVLEKFKMDKYLNTAVQDHAVASGIFIHNNFGIDDEMIIYPIMFHSCPILPVYQILNDNLQKMIDVMVLSDKLSASIVKPQFDKKVKIDLKSMLYGISGCEFNFTQALLMARLIGHDNSKDAHSNMMVEYYHERALQTNPLIFPEGQLPIVKNGKIKKQTSKKSNKPKKKKEVKNKNGKESN